MRTTTLMSIALLTLASGCMAGMAAGHAGQMAQPAQSPPPPGAAIGGMGAVPMEACPMAVAGTQVAAADTPDGESVTFTSPDRAADLRARVHAMADMHNRRMEGMHGGMGQGGMMGGGMMGGGSMGPGAGKGQMSMMPPPSHATAEDVEGGARIVVTPNDPADLERLRSSVRMHAEHMRESGTCAMRSSSAM